jgi:hypothetical protein
LDFLELWAFFKDFGATILGETWPLISGNNSSFGRDFFLRSGTFHLEIGHFCIVFGAGPGDGRGVGSGV